MIDYLNADYTTNPLNPLLKLLIFILFVIITVIYYDTKRLIGGEVQKIIGFLLLFSVFMALGSLIRYFGHGTEFGFTPEYSLKWFQSLAYLSGAICCIIAARKMLTLFWRKDE